MPNFYNWDFKLFFWDNLIFIGYPDLVIGGSKLFIGNPQIFNGYTQNFIGDPKFFIIETTSFSFGDPKTFIWGSGRIFTGLRWKCWGFDENLGSPIKICRLQWKAWGLQWKSWGYQMTSWGLPWTSFWWDFGEGLRRKGSLMILQGWWFLSNSKQKVAL